MSKKPANRNRLLSEFQNFKFNIAKDFTTQFNNLENLALNLRQVDAEKSAGDLKFAVMHGLPEDDEYLEKYMASWELKESLTYEDFKEQLLSIEKKESFVQHRKSLRQERNKAFAMKANAKRQHPFTCRFCKDKHPPRKCPKAPKCDHCQKKGHDESKCWIKHPELRKSKSPSSKDNNNSAEPNHEANFAVAYMTMTPNILHASPHSFYVDSGSSIHLVNDLSLLHNVKNTEYSIATANNQSIKGTQLGSLVLELNNERITLNNVVFAKKLSNNLISVGQLLRQGFTVEFNKDHCIIGTAKNRKVSIKAAGNIFKMTPHVIMPSNKAASYYSSCPPTVNSIISSDSHYIHSVLGHIGKSKINRLIRHQAVKGLPELLQNYDGIPYCEACIKAKHPKHSFASSNSSSFHVGQLLHTDLAGPIVPQSVGKKRYVLNVIDDYSRYTFTYLLHKKSDAAEAIINCISTIENQKQCTVKTLRSDRGGEFLNIYLSKYLNHKGIIHQLTAPYTPQQNGVAERYNRT
ncbi:hypothetical protein MP638_002655, partial [Amoeboaphelidium occidentale]